jgi:hypothetical protein
MLFAIRQAVELVRRRFGPLRTLPPPNVRKKATPRLEELEARLTPVTVNSLADMPVPQTPPNLITLRSAIASGATYIDFAPSVSGNINLYTELPTLNGVTINNATGNGITVLGDWNFRLIETAPGTTNEIDNLDLEQGGGVNTGAGISNSGSLTLNGCYMSLCSANQTGGAIANAASATLTLDNTTLYENTAGTAGGGIWNSADGTVYIDSGSAIDNNSSTLGGGIANYGGLTSTGAEVKYNGASDSGGGIYNGALGTTTMTTTDIEYNKATNAGGGFYVKSGSLTLTYSTLSNNTAPVGFGAGGAVSIAGGGSWTDNGGNTITDPVDRTP